MGAAFRWRQASGVTNLGNLGGPIYATAVSGDGAYVFGSARDAGGNDYAFQWTAPIGLILLNGPAGLGFYPRAASYDGSIVAGVRISGSTVPYVWHAATGYQTAVSFLSQYRVTVPPGWTLTDVYGVSSDGLAFCGIGTSPTGRTEGWLARIPCYANCDGSATHPVLNVNDFTCFRNRFSAGDPWANCDSSTNAPPLNVNDFLCFMNQYATGCP